jgi:mannose-6-phosphate isomerase-like protein (cupin superfamily)
MVSLHNLQLRQDFTEVPMSFFGRGQPMVLGPDEGTHLNVLGELITLMVSGQQTGGAFTVLAETSPPGGGTPLHTHHGEDEALYILEGEYEIKCGEHTVRAGPRSFVFAPRDIPHQLTNVSSGPSKILGIISPAGFEGLWLEISRLQSPPAIEKIHEIAAKYRLEIHAS